MTSPSGEIWQSECFMALITYRGLTGCSYQSPWLFFTGFFNKETHRNSQMESLQTGEGNHLNGADLESQLFSIQRIEGTHPWPGTDTR